MGTLYAEVNRLNVNLIQVPTLIVHMFHGSKLDREQRLK